LHAQQSSLVEAAANAEHLQVDVIRNDVHARRERRDGRRIGEIDRERDRDAEAHGEERHERAQTVRAKVPEHEGAIERAHAMPERTTV
jgi:hypothetical protein